MLPYQLPHQRFCNALINFYVFLHFLESAGHFPNTGFQVIGSVFISNVFVFFGVFCYRGGAQLVCWF